MGLLGFIGLIGLLGLLGPSEIGSAFHGINYLGYWVATYRLTSYVLRVAGLTI